MTTSFFDTMPRIIGHRGARGLAPENTLVSFRKAAEVGTKSIEIDVTLTADGVPVIHHDMDVKRCTDGSGPILLKTFEEIRDLDAGSWFSDQYRGVRIPTLEETLDCLADLGISLNLEVKPCAGWQVPTAETVGQFLNTHLKDRFPILLSSFDIEALVTIGRITPHLPLGYLTEAIAPDWEKRLSEAGAASLHVQREFVTEAAVRDVQSAGYKFLVYTVNDEDEAKRLLDWGVDAVITDYPDRLLPLI
ncbi:glycerophosphoryl diester phosphodiesterase [Sneathiella chinensis]|uniref:Glycerophosphoryl diester phosphodiesterase n=1 Tax=Sneathiella chinensis TaxID=349750 RepID=A0ABQ5U4H5_9PROT|nr:glycerophosphoryl diester phosphodiesterase [Sneathiella chinensis]GLQ06628.1 glycerophosphoryl diester phosphodiesterase [Sneathiella chinensis]